MSICPKEVILEKLKDLKKSISTLFESVSVVFSPSSLDLGTSMKQFDDISNCRFQILEKQYNLIEYTRSCKILPFFIIDEFLIYKKRKTFPHFSASSFGKT